MTNPHLTLRREAVAVEPRIIALEQSRKLPLDAIEYSVVAGAFPVLSQNPSYVDVVSFRVFHLCSPLLVSSYILYFFDL
jgi:hypothetical protein